MPEYIYEVSSSGSTWEQVGELIRCRDCYYFLEDIKYEGDRALADMVCGRTDEPTYSTDYCSRAKRKEE